MIQDRIEFYEQLLELEPGSKLFYTLARLYWEHDDLEKAAKILESGLEKHPEYIQARLLLAKVMERTGNLSATREIYRDIFDRILDTPEFWSGLAASFREEGSDDPALAADFLSSWISDHSLTWSRVLQNGLDHLKNSHVPETTPDEPATAHPDPEPDESGPEPDTGSADYTSQDFSLKPLDNEDLQRNSEEGALEDPLKGMDTLEEHTQPQASVEDTSELSWPQDALEGHPGAGEHDSKQDNARTREHEPLHGEAGPQEELQEIEPDNAYREEEFDDPEEVEDIKFDGEARTRSMADLLAAQEEYQKALDIYNELWVRSLPGQERRELEGIISELNKILGLEHDFREQPSETIQMEEPSVPGTENPEQESDSTEEKDPGQLLKDREINSSETYPADAGEREKGIDTQAPKKKEVMSFLSRLADRLDKT